MTARDAFIFQAAADALAQRPYELADRLAAFNDPDRPVSVAEVIDTLRAESNANA